MFGSETLDVVIGILFVYLTLSLVCSAMQEMVAGWLRWRAQYLYEGIRTLLDDAGGKGLVRDFYAHPLINTLFPGEYEPGRHQNLPSYIPARAFALAMMDLAVPRAPFGDSSGAAGATVTLQQPFPPPVNPRLRDTLTQAPLLPPKVSQALLTLSDAAGGDANGIRMNIEDWFNNAMGRVSSEYKRRTQAVVLIVGCFVAAAVNADSIGIVTMLSTNRAVRESLVAAATQTSQPAQAGLSNRVEAIRASALPIGWVSNAAPDDLRSIPRTPGGWVQKVVGILLTIAAISLGAPFWFDILSKVTVIRSAMKPVEDAARNSAAAAK